MSLCWGPGVGVGWAAQSLEVKKSSEWSSSTSSAGGRRGGGDKGLEQEEVLLGGRSNRNAVSCGCGLCWW